MKSTKMNFNWSPIVVVVLLLFTTSAQCQTTYIITNPEQIEDHTYVAGDEIILASGTYDTDKRFDFVGNGTADEPITLRAENPGGVKFTGGLKLNISGNYMIIDGFYWKGGFGASNFIQFRNGSEYANYSTIQNCIIDGLAIHPDDIVDDMANNTITKHRWVVLYGTYNSVINCSFMNKESAGALILAEYQYNAEANPCTNVGHTISNNYFYKYKKIDNTLSNAGDSETIRLGSSENQNVNSGVVVRNNYFVESDGENEIITNKSKGNIFTNNTFRRCRGSLVLRHGSNAMVDGNYFLGENVDGTGGVRISDSDHTITNNYIQDCITVESQSKWNNGVTFLGGGDDYAVPCTATNVSNGYQKSENINFSNNTIVNTNAPFFFNTSKGTTDPIGTVSDNLIYFDDDNPNVSDILSGDDASAYEDIGTALNYFGNIYIGANLGTSNAGFAQESSIIASGDGEIFSFTGATDKGAHMGDYQPTTDDMVGYGIGACFLDFKGENINDGDCQIIPGQYLTITSLPIFSDLASSGEVTVNANVNWSATSNNSWITVNPDFGSGNVSVTIMVSTNSTTTSRVGTVTFSQESGEGDIVRTLTVTQKEAELTNIYELINIGTGLPTDMVTLHSFSKEEVNGVDKFNYAINTLDKDQETLWAADDDDISAGDYKGDGEYIIYDLSSIHPIDFLQFSTTNKSDPFGFQIWVSTTGTDDSDFSMILPTNGDLLFTATNTTDFNQYEIITAEARFVKLMGFGRYNSDGDTRKSVWSAVREIEFYSSKTVSTVESENLETVNIYPLPAHDLITMENISGVQAISIYNLNGQSVMRKYLLGTQQDKVDLDVSSFPNGVYLAILKGEKNYRPVRFSVLK